MKAKLARTNPVRVGGVAQPVNGTLKMLGSETPGGEFASVVSEPLSFDSAGNVTVTIPKGDLAGRRFFKPAIVAPAE